MKFLKVVAGMLVFALLSGTSLQVFAANEITHGTSKTEVTADMVDNTPPADYKINSATQADAKEGVYNKFFLKDALQEVHIQINENNLNYLLQNAVDEPYVMTDSVTIGNTTVDYCGLRTKGNFTLYHSYHDNPGSDRFSFTVNFGKYINKTNYGEKQTFFGCEKISFNNFFFDKSMMKEFFSLMLMEEMGLPTPQFGLAKLYINDQYYGVYFMVEAMDTSILEQHWNVDGKDLSSYLCKPTGTNFHYLNLKEDSAPLWEWDQKTYAEVEDMIPTALEWSRKLTCLSDGTDFGGNPIDVNSEEYIDLLSTVLDLDEVIKYFATASWLCQLDNMFTNSQNYGLYLSPEGVATLLPWDYDLAFGCYYPSSAETTANYPVDVMYRLDQRSWGSEATTSRNFYRDFPLFLVIYQNKNLMYRYHSYMLECSQIAALGGTLASNGKSYDPANFHGYIEKLQDALLAAAAEETASNVYYMNGIRQPEDVENALPNLSKIIAMRSVGVYAQLMGMDTLVSTTGCDLATLGNAVTGEFSNSGNLIAVDPATGIFVQANYSGGRRTAAPVLKVTEGDTQAVRELLGAGKNDTVLAYELHIGVKAKSAYTVTVPMSPESISGWAFYLYENGVVTPLEVTTEGSLLSFTCESLGTLVLHRESTVSNGAKSSLDYLVFGGIGLTAVVILAVVIVSGVRRKR